MQRGIYIVVLILLVGCKVGALKVEKGFQALDIYNYFEAKQNFEKALKKDSSAPAYGLSIIYLRQDNPFYQLDSALKFADMATNHYGDLKESTKEKYAQFGVDSTSIYRHRSQVSKAVYRNRQETHTVEAYQDFIDHNEWSMYVDSAIYHRDRLAFEKAKDKNTSTAFNAFLEKYPNSYLESEAQSAYDRLLYKEITKSNKFIDYLDFIRRYPNSPYRADAEDQIYAIYTETGSAESYKNFIQEYPENRNVPFAWKKLFNTYLQNDYSSSSIQSFLEEFKDYPFKADLRKQLNLVERVYLPIKERNKWGFIDESGQHYIAPEYEGAELFHEGLALVVLNGKFGFIDKTGTLVIEAIFDDAYRIQEGHAVVQVGEKWGMINRSGEFVIAPEYEDLGNLNEGLTYFAAEETYGYFDKKGNIRLKAQYTDADNFKNGHAIVSMNDLYGVIDVFGTTAVPFKYDRLSAFGESGNYTVLLDDYWGVINENGDTLLPFEYDYIGKLMSNRAIIEKEGLFNYIDENGELLLKEWIETYPESRQLATFNEGYARIAFEDGYNLMDTTGKKLFTKNKPNVGGYGSLIAVQKADKWGFVNPNGTLVLGYNYTSAESFKGKYAKAGGAPLTGLINTSGDYVVEPYFEKLERINDSILIAKSRGSYGLLTTKGDTLLSIKYNSIELFAPEIVEIKTSEALFYYHLRKKSFLRKEEE